MFEQQIWAWLGDFFSNDRIYQGRYGLCGGMCDYWTALTNEESELLISFRKDMGLEDTDYWLPTKDQYMRDIRADFCYMLSLMTDEELKELEASYENN